MRRRRVWWWLRGADTRIWRWRRKGLRIARWLNERGVAAFVLQYRLGPKYHHPIELEDAQRAIRMVRAHAAEYGVVDGSYWDVGIFGGRASGGYGGDEV